jgi:hypothetical protein
VYVCVCVLCESVCVCVCEKALLCVRSQVSVSLCMSECVSVCICVCLLAPCHQLPIHARRMSVATMYRLSAPKSEKCVLLRNPAVALSRSKVRNASKED